MNTLAASTIAAGVKRGTLKAGEVLEACIARIERHDQALCCFTERTFERARREAAAIDASQRAGEKLPPLAGVPYAVKNLFDIAHSVTVAGGAVNRANPPATSDAVLVARMRDAGAVLVGALNMDEHAYGFTTENTHFGTTRNPHDKTRVAGGSSGGSAAAVAAGFVPLTLGSDTNGSIRVPSSLCGVFGLKPTYGRLPRSGTYPFVHSLDHLGPFGLSAHDLALAYDSLQGWDAGDAACTPRMLEPTVDLARMAADAAGEVGAATPFGQARMAILGGHFEQWAGPAARAAVARVAAALGVTEQAELRGAARVRAAAFITTGAEAGALHRARLATRYDDYEPLSRDRLVAGSLIPATWYTAAQRVRAQVFAEVLQLFARYDVLIAPATPVCATPIGCEWLEINGARVPARASMGLLSQPVSALGLPVCTVPVWPEHAPDRHLPIGVQLIAAPWREERVLAVAAQLEALGVAGVRTAVL